ncbi:MAG: crotonase/enoyl-CoA hydratase family protein [Pseudomonadota bacterium]|nr:crotonase/enoyl-CoA hydratase family protein [Pseudomonadota bacterium]
MDEPIRYAQDGHVATLTLNRPATRNALTDADIVEAFVSACLRVNDDPSVRVVIVTGAGAAFSSGGNLKHMRDRVGIFAGNAVQIRDRYRAGIQRLARTLYELEVPTIAAINGAAYGAGCDTALACDIRIASETATFAENFIKLGLISGDGGSWLLPRAVGLSRACEMSFTGDSVDAGTALSWGLVSKVVAPDRLLPEALHLAQRIAVNAPGALRMAKRLIRESQHVRFDTLLELAAAMQGACHQTRDHEEAVQAFFDKREPRFKGN